MKKLSICFRFVLPLRRFFSDEPGSRPIGIPFSSVIVLMDQARATLAESARLIVREIQRGGFTARIETVNTVEAWLGSRPGHAIPNVRRRLIHTGNLADLLPLALVLGQTPARSTRRAPRLSCMPRQPARYPFGSNSHIGDVGHTLIFRPGRGGNRPAYVGNATANGQRKRIRGAQSSKRLVMPDNANCLRATEPG